MTKFDFQKSKSKNFENFEIFDFFLKNDFSGKKSSKSQFEKSNFRENFHFFEKSQKFSFFLKNLKKIQKFSISIFEKIFSSRKI